MAEEDLELEEDVGTPQERQRTLRALREWAGSQPDQNMPIFITGVDMHLTPGELISHFEDETAIGVAILDVFVLRARELKEMKQSEIQKFLGRQFPLTNFREAEDK